MKTLTFDTETTGVDTTTARVIELCVCNGYSEPRTWRFKPNVEISPEAQAVHGISAEDLEGCPRFIEVANEILPYFQEAEVIVGYNVGFDIAMISEEFERCAITLDFKSKLIIDPLKLWYQKEPRNLESAHERFVGGKLENAHAAEADVMAANAVLHGMLQEWKLEDTPWEKLADICEPDRHKYVGITNHFLWDDEGNVIFGFGTHKGERAYHQQSYLKWMLRGTFPSSVKNDIRAMLDGSLKRP
jgi:DNA polymerase-3 subunit epsilon